MPAGMADRKRQRKEGQRRGLSSKAKGFPKPGSWQHLVGLALVFGVLGIGMSIRHAEDWNTDAIAYLRLAHYWVEGPWRLAVSGYWGPLFCWIFAGVLGLGGSPFLAVRVGMLIGAGIFVWGGWSMVREFLEEEQERLWASVLIGGLAVVAIGGEVTPDLLVAGCLLLACVRWFRPDWSCRGKIQLWSGVLWGVAYLAKAVALPAGVLWLATAVMFHRIWTKASWGRLSRALCRTVLAAGVIMVPWVTVLSLKYHRLTFSTAAEAAHAIVGPNWPAPVHPFGLTLHSVEPGRVTAWEDPTSLPYPRWSPFTSVEAFRHQCWVCLRNIKYEFHILNGFDLLGFGIFVLIGTVGVGAIRRDLWQQWKTGWMVWLVLGWCLLFLPGYLSPREERYFYAGHPLLVILAFWGMERVGQWLPLSYKRLSFWLRWVVVGSFGGILILRGIGAWEKDGRWPVYAARIVAQAIEREGDGGAVAGSGFLQSERVGLYAAYFLGIPWVGDQEGLPEDRLEALGVRWVVLRFSRPENKRFQKDPRYEEVKGLSWGIRGAPEFPIRVYHRIGGKGEGKKQAAGDAVFHSARLREGARIVR